MEKNLLNKLQFKNLSVGIFRKITNYPQFSLTICLFAGGIFFNLLKLTTNFGV